MPYPQQGGGLLKIFHKWMLRFCHMAKRTGPRPMGIIKDNYKLGALALAALVVASGSFALAGGQIAFQPGSFLAAVFGVLANKPQIVITKNLTSTSGTIPAMKDSPVATFDVKPFNVSYWATLRSLDIAVAINDASAKSPLTISDLFITYTYCVPQGKTYGYYFQDAVKYGVCATYTSAPGTGAHKISILSADKTAEGYLLRVGFKQEIYPQQLPGILTIYARPAYKPTADGSIVPSTYVSSLRASIIGGSGGGDQCKKYTATIPYAYAQCYPRLTFVSVPVYGNVVSVARDAATPVSGINVTFISASTAVTQGQNANDDVGEFRIKYKVKAVGTAAYISKHADAQLSGNTVGKTTVIFDRAGTPFTTGAIVTLNNLTDTATNAAGLYQLDANEENTFEVVGAAILPTAGAAGQYRMRLSGIRWGTSPSDATPDNSFTGLDTFKTNYIGLN